MPWEWKGQGFPRKGYEGTFGGDNALYHVRDLEYISICIFQDLFNSITMFHIFYHMYTILIYNYIFDFICMYTLRHMKYWTQVSDANAEIVKGVSVLMSPTNFELH